MSAQEIDTESVNRVLANADPEIVAEVESVMEAAKSSTYKSRSSSQESPPSKKASPKHSPHSKKSMLDEEMPFPDDDDEDEDVPSIPMSKRYKRRPTIEEEPSTIKKKLKRRQKVPSEEDEDEEVPSIPIKKRQQIVQADTPPRRATRSRGIAVTDGYTSDISQVKLKKAK